ncbi:hypothetical protein [Pedobacter rhodius]|uniref:Outer membrane protein beta-barrel domain-containing protein n=1 Tax=Pedobacter rhodius TaxID=3004098 RepID=A0ABT4KYQ3_9SPHI|nr:hypothetical protein [Pedobacter sp. SJ11]MCZ4223337.1 hypothetical protein [Pedobacter sp. SJ11]
MNLNRTLSFLLAIISTATYAQNSNNLQTYPKLAGYVGILHPIATFSSAGTESNFNHYYAVGMPTGINIWKSSKIGFSAEFVPTIRVENGTSKMSNFLFHPGVLVALGNGFTFAGRAAFETSGRYGLTPVLNKTVIKGKSTNMFAALPLPIRFGNDRPATLGIGFQFGISF